MRPSHLGVQTAVVLAMVCLVSWPQFRPLRAQSVWKYVPQMSPQAQVDELAQVDTDRARNAVVGVGAGRAGYVAGGTVSDRPGTATVPTAPKTIIDELAPPPLGVAALGGTLNALVGFARTSQLAPIPYARIVLRNIMTGRIEATATANSDGRFTFLDLNSSAYVVELLGANGAVVATSEVIPVAHGDLRQTVVQTAAMATIAAALGNNTSSTLQQMTTAARNTNVTRTSANLSPQASPNSPTAGGR